MMTDKFTDYITLTKRKENFCKDILISFLKPPVIEEIIRNAKAFIDFEQGCCCAICDVCGLPFYWDNQTQLEILFEYMAEDTKVVVFDETRTRACQTLRVPREVTKRCLTYESFLDYMTIVAEKNMGLRDWVTHIAFQDWKAANDTKLLPLKKSKEKGEIALMERNRTFDFQVGQAIGLVDKIFSRGQFAECTKFPVLKVKGEEIDNNVKQDELLRWKRYL